MPKSELMTKILNDYVAANPHVNEMLLGQFCDYAAKWLADCGLVGLGIAASGMRLRTSTGDEITLYESDDQTAADSTGQAVAIGGTAASVNAGRGFSDNMPSFGITGR